jgi:hypothetical protein
MEKPENNVTAEADTTESSDTFDILDHEALKATVNKNEIMCNETITFDELVEAMRRVKAEYLKYKTVKIGKTTVRFEICALNYKGTEYTIMVSVDKERDIEVFAKAGKLKENLIWIVCDKGAYYLKTHPDLFLNAKSSRQAHQALKDNLLTQLTSDLDMLKAYLLTGPDVDTRNKVEFTIGILEVCKRQVISGVSVSKAKMHHKTEYGVIHFVRGKMSPSDDEHPPKDTMVKRFNPFARRGKGLKKM